MFECGKTYTHKYLNDTTSLCVMRKSSAVQLMLWKTLCALCDSHNITKSTVSKQMQKQCYSQDNLGLINTKESLNHIMEVMTGHFSSRSPKVQQTFDDKDMVAR